MTLDMIVKANDGRGMGHIGRVANFISYPAISSRILAIVNNGYEKLVPNGISYTSIIDCGYRVDLDKKTIIQKFPTSYGSSDILEATEKYYSVISNSLHKDAKLFYIDDQNSMETVFLDEIGQVVNKNLPKLRSIMPKGHISMEIETQYLDSKTKLRALEESDYIHLSCDADFFKNVSSDSHLVGGLADKVIPMGFPLSESIKNFFDKINLDRENKKLDIISQYNNSCSNFVYCTFGAGSGADEVLDVIYKVAQERKNVLFGISDPKDSMKSIYVKKGFDIKNTDKGFIVGELDNLYLMKSQSRDEHLTKVGCADLTIQGNGSGTTYESIYARTPMLNIPLKRPGFEQLIKGMGVTKTGGGKLLLLDELYNYPEAVELVKKNELGVNYLNKENTIDAIDEILNDKSFYAKNLFELRNAFKDEKTIGQTLEMMAQGVSPGDIRYRLGLGRV
jgi:hypothetical protein